MKRKQPRRIFSELFKREKVRLLETGKTTVRELCRLYEVSETSIYKWKLKYSTLPGDERVVVEKDSEYLKVVQLSKRLEDMERVIGKQQIKLDYMNGVIAQASKHYEEDIEKKFGQV